MSREAAIEAGARALAGLRAGEPWPTNEELGGSATGTRDDEYRYALREDAAAVIDAALPHLTGEPVGWAVVLNLHERQLLNDGAIRTRSAARDLALALRLSGETPTVVALVPVEDAP